MLACIVSQKSKHCPISVYASACILVPITNNVQARGIGQVHMRHEAEVIQQNVECNDIVKYFSHATTSHPVLRCSQFSAVSVTSRIIVHTAAEKDRKGKRFHMRDSVVGGFKTK